MVLIKFWAEVDKTAILCYNNSTSPEPIWQAMSGGISMKYSYPVVLFVLVAMMSISLGIGVYIGESQQTHAELTTPEPVVMPKCESIDPSLRRSKRDERNQQIAFAVSQPIRIRQEFRNIQRGRYATLEELGQATRLSYKVAGQIDDLIKDIEVNQLRDSEIGYQTKDLKHLKREVLLNTLDMIDRVARRGGTDICLWEGGCLNNDESIGFRNTARTIREELAAL